MDFSKLLNGFVTIGGWQKLCGGTEGPRRKVCRELRFVAIYTLFGDLWAKKLPFWVKIVLLRQEVHYYMVYIAYFTELNSKI